MRNKTGCRASHDVVFGKYTIVTSLFPISPQIYFPLSLLSDLPNAVAVVLVYALLLLSILGVGGVVGVLFTTMHPPVSDVVSVLSSVPAAMDSIPATLSPAVIVAISIKAVLSMTSESALLFLPPGLSQVLVPISAAAALLILHVRSCLISFPEVTKKGDLIYSNLCSWGGVQSGAVLCELSCGVEPDVNISPIKTHGAQAALLAYVVEEFPKFLHAPDIGVRLLVFLCLRLPLCLE